MFHKDFEDIEKWAAGDGNPGDECPAYGRSSYCRPGGRVDEVKHYVFDITGP